MVMRLSLVGALSAVLCTALFVSAVTARFPAEDGPKGWVDADELAQADPEFGPAFRALDARLAGARHRIGLRMEVARDLADGRLTLGQAVDQFRVLNAGQPAGLEVLAQEFPSAGEEELVCRQVVGFVRSLAKTDTIARKALAAITIEVACRFPPAAGIPAR